MKRRTFLRGMAMSLAGAGALGLAACAPNGGDGVQLTETGSSQGASHQDWADKVSATKDADVVVVGAGTSGLAAAVQAAELGLATLLLEAQNELPGRGPEGIAAIDSSFQIQQGIHADIAAIIQEEGKMFNWRINPLFIEDMFKRSGDNLDWLVEQGVQFTGQVDTYKGMSEHTIFHWFPGDHDSPHAYNVPMEEKFQSYGNTEYLRGVRGRDLIINDGVVAGLYATSATDVLQINAKAVILATGGYASDTEMVAERWPGLPVGRWVCDGFPTCIGDGLKMALSAGGVDVSTKRSLMGYVVCNCAEKALSTVGLSAAACWINEAGERFVPEDHGNANLLMTMNPIMEQRESFAVVDSSILDSLAEGGAQLALKSIEEGETEIVSGESLEALAQAMGVDPATLTQEVSIYNQACEAGFDGRFGKAKENLVKIEKAPFFAFRQVACGHCNVGGIEVNRKYEVVTREGMPIIGLYATGLESNMLGRETYTLNISGSCMCNNVDSGRVAAMSAKNYIG